MAVTRRIKEIGGHWHTRPDKSRRTPEQAPDMRYKRGVVTWENPMGWPTFAASWTQTFFGGADERF